MERGNRGGSSPETANDLDNHCHEGRRLVCCGALTVNKRFTIDGSAALEQHLADVCARVADGVRSIVPANILDGVVLGGGYGRGEGGVLRENDQEQPYNDLEFYVFVRGSSLFGERRYRARLHDLAEKLVPHAGLDVEFKVLSASKLRRSPPSMFFYDLVSGHRCVVGGEELFTGCDRHRRAADIPLSEATRLLMNRCSGLLFARERLERDVFGAGESDFAGRNLAKARLAFGDIVLVAHGLYHWSCRERHRLLQSMNADAAPEMDRVKQAHAAGVEFKLNPVRSRASRDILMAEHENLCSLGRALWLWLENRRLGTPFTSVREYALSGINKCPGTPAWRNWLVNLKSFGPREALKTSSLRYPRERLFNALPLLLWEKAPDSIPNARDRLIQCLGACGESFQEWVRLYEKSWMRFQ